MAHGKNNELLCTVSIAVFLSISAVVVPRATFASLRVATSAVFSLQTLPQILLPRFAIADYTRYNQLWRTLNVALGINYPNL